MNMLEPRPDIHELFCHYNSLYFSDALGACIVSWDPRMTSMKANCYCREAGLCEIILSGPLLKSCSSTDLKNVLLHGMVHAFLWVTQNDSNHRDHNSNFWAIANLINSNYKCDDDVQRPSDGYKITTHDGFHIEVDTYGVDQWMYATCGDLVKNGDGREPSPSDSTEKKGRSSDCDILLCEWDSHQKQCPGRYEAAHKMVAFDNKCKALEDQVLKETMNRK